MKKQITIAKLKKKVWTEFSKYVRLKYADDSGMVSCYTCGTVKHWKQMQCAHLLDGRYNSILFEENCVRPGCYHCNVGLNGNKEEYIPKFIDECGEREFQRLKEQKKKVFQFKREELEEMLQYYKMRIKDYAYKV